MPVSNIFGNIQILSEHYSTKHRSPIEVCNGIRIAVSRAPDRSLSPQVPAVVGIEDYKRIAGQGAQRIHPITIFNP
jgi:hypothetical protein